MVSLLVAKVWHYWLSIALLAPIVLLLIGMGVLYLVKVVSLKYPRE
jgi:CHASE1-domain containing sensor protein